jgi:hypothetical protein
MYKILIFIFKSDKEFIDYFKQNFLPLLSEINGNEVRLGEIESDLLLEVKFSHFCEISANSKDEMDQKLNSASGRKLGKLLMELHHKISVINVSFH